MAVAVIVSLVSVKAPGDDVIEYIELLSAEFITLVRTLTEDCETLIELVLLGLIVLNIELSVNVGLAPALK